MPKPNKYNIRAIRNELDNHIRYKSWKKFRSVFESLDLELQTAVAREQTGKNRQSSAPALVCALLEGFKVSLCPPIDLFELILRACPISTKNNSKNNYYGSSNPISIAIDRHAPIRIIKLLLKYDETKELLSRPKKQQREKHPPILKVARHLQGNHGSNTEELLRLLVAHDVTKQSLLIPSPTKQKVALCYVSSFQTPFLPQVSNDDNRNIIIDETLFEFMLLQTQEAVEIQQGRRKPLVEGLLPKDKADRGDENDEVGFFAILSANALSSSDSSFTSSQETEDEVDDDVILNENSSNNATCAMKLWCAMITCAHLLGTRKTCHLMGQLVHRTQDLRGVNTHGDTLLHHICRSIDVSAFLVACLIHNKGCPEKRNLVQHLIAECPGILLQKNEDGDIPLHLAIRSNQSFDLLHHLCPPTHAASVLSKTTQENQLPLHLSIEYQLHHPTQDIVQLWKKYPEAVTIMDGKHHLFPFQLVAAIDSAHSTPRSASSVQEPTKKGKLSSKISKDYFFDLDLSYQLLRGAPEVIQHAK